MTSSRQYGRDEQPGRRGYRANMENLMPRQVGMADGLAESDSCKGYQPSATGSSVAADQFEHGSTVSLELALADAADVFEVL